MRIVAISDTHGHLPHIPECDLLLIGGDICPVESHAVDYQIAWLQKEFRAWLESVPAKHIVGISGNHDFVFEQEPDKVSDLPWTYLKDSETTIDGIRIYGTPWQPWFYDWAFNASDEELEVIFEKVPDGVDVLLCHGPPDGYGDMTIRNCAVGSVAQLRAIDRVHPKLSVFGHIHEGRGHWIRGKTLLANVTMRDVAYDVVFAPMVFEYENGIMKLTGE